MTNTLAYTIADVCSLASDVFNNFGQMKNHTNVYKSTTTGAREKKIVIILTIRKKMSVCLSNFKTIDFYSVKLL